MRIGYLLAEFPGATHSFNWREVRALEARGLTCDLVSTRRPSADKMSHVWTTEALARTTYLFPPRPALLAGAIGSIFRSGPLGWARLVSAILTAEGIHGVKGRGRLAVLAVMGAELAGLARRRGWKYIQVHSLADTAHVAMFAHLISGQRYGLTLHANLPEFGPNQKNKWKHADYAICITNRLRDCLRKELPGSIPGRIDVAPMGVELERFTRSAAYEPWQGKGEARLFACGRLNFGKGHDQLVRAIRLLRDQGVEARLRIAGYDGGSGFRAELERLIDELKLGQCVELLGALSEPAVRQELQQAHLFALVSRSDELGVATMEAMAMCLPAVVSRTGGVAEMIDDGVDGVLVESDPAAIAAALARILRDPELARGIGQAGRRKIERKFHSGISAATLLRYLGVDDEGKTLATAPTASVGQVVDA
ncbi:MAG TPA: exopolysaccharide biosynthesis GT4 family glycosyltransferase EpsE [Tepidisphaeraceae bacterium]|nr:exopolysaccharide biosynthesis GT4 family glycosyltransferase EpsE [Tepidisphaeraceae bacterium]